MNLHLKSLVGSPPETLLLFPPSLSSRELFHNLSDLPAPEQFSGSQIFLGIQSDLPILNHMYEDYRSLNHDYRETNHRPPPPGNNAFHSRVSSTVRPESTHRRVAQHHKLLAPRHDSPALSTPFLQPPRRPTSHPQEAHAVLP
ncbi:hypothetical protein C2S52_009882 [Perilla frutescens var. hirtella]|nr:hypothetical protein C2S52_009882 [Perilla frutescens var. hirtella]